MSRAKKKMATIHDLQGRVGDQIITKADCDLICTSVSYYIATMSHIDCIPEDIKRKKIKHCHNIYRYFKDLTRIPRRKRL